MSIEAEVGRKRHTQQTGVVCTSGVWKIGNFLQITYYIWKTVQDRRIVSIAGE